MVACARTFGKIAASNALSDIYAMGGTPLYALNIVCFPQDLDNQILQEILAGGASICAEAGATLAGGHSIYDSGIKYGLAVTGIAETNNIYRNNTPRIGDKLILTKPLGVGVVTAADRSGSADAADIAEAIASMERLNKYAAEKMSNFNISACTDITGFGLLGHLLEMTCGKVTAEINCEALPHLKNVKQYVEKNIITGGGKRNRNFVADRADVSKLPSWIAELCFDPQTSGGLLIAVESEQANELLAEIKTDDKAASIIGSIKRLGEKEILCQKKL